jgi:hypothetical protein
MNPKIYSIIKQKIPNICIKNPELIAASLATPTAIKLIAQLPSKVPNPPIPCIGRIHIINKKVEARKIDSNCRFIPMAIASK